MKLSDFEVGMAVAYKDYELSRERDFVGLVTDVTDDVMVVTIVRNIMRPLPDGNSYYNILCYDDVGAVYEKHKNNVRLRNCPPPFSDLSNGVSDNVYVQTDNIKCFAEDELNECHVTILDNGIKVDADVMREVKHHLWQEQPQKEFTHHGYRQGSDKVADIGKDDDAQFGD